MPVRYALVVEMSRISKTAARAAPFWASLLIALIAVLTFLPVVGHDSLEWDDPHNIFRNPDLRSPTFRGWLSYWDFRRPVHGLYVPLTYTEWFAVAPLARRPDGSLDPRVFHAANLLVHVACAVAIFALLRLLIGRAIPATIGAILFAVHPVQVESVAWISGMKDLLCGLFGAVALLLYVKSIQASRRRAAWYLLASVALAAALLSKPVAVVLPLVAAVIDCCLLGRPVRAVAASLCPWVLLAVPIALVTRMAQPIPDVYAICPPSVRPLVAGDTLAFYARQIVFPARLALDYGRAPDLIASDPRNWLWWLVPILIGIILFVARRQAWGVVVGALIFVVALTPVLGIVPFGAQLYSSVADHYLYLPMLGVALAAAWVAARVSPTIAIGLALPILLVLAARSWVQTRHWRDTTAIFSHTLQINPRSWICHINLGAEALARDDGALAERHTRAAMKLRPGAPLLWLNLGIALGQQSRFSESADALRRAVELKPDDARTHYFLGQALRQLGQRSEAEREFREAARLDQGFRGSLLDW